MNGWARRVAVERVAAPADGKRKSREHARGCALSGGHWSTPAQRDSSTTDTDAQKFVMSGRVAVVAEEAELHIVCRKCLRHGSPLCLYRPSQSLQSMRLRVFSSLWLWAFASFWLRRCTADRRLPISLACERCSPGYTTADATRPLMELFLCTCVVLLSWLGFAAAIV